MRSGGVFRQMLVQMSASRIVDIDTRLFVGSGIIETNIPAHSESLRYLAVSVSMFSQISPIYENFFILEIYLKYED